MKIRLKRLTTYKGNPYYAGVYNEKELPDVILNDPELVDRPNDGETKTPNFHQSLKEQTVKVGGTVQNQKKSNYQPVPPKIIDNPEEESSKSKQTTQERNSTEEDKSARDTRDESNKEDNNDEPVFNVNTATTDELASLDGVTLPTARQVVEEREKKKFVDFEDMDKRVTLKGNRKWEGFSDRLSF